ncbi:MAG TPA: U32 family peptidase [Desulfomicrobiaceae bacterium]|nr:U32 family peptidase [Desulfomicrobiaceae bacterium]
MTQKPNLPEILAPAGNTDSFLAALAAGADAVYCGLKHFSARMEAENFSIKELAQLTGLAHARGARVYVTLNSLLKPGEPDQAGRLLERLERIVKPDAVIAQDLGVAELARQVGFTGQLHLSTLANCTHPAGLLTAKKFGFSRVVLPRELSVDEIRDMAAACPEGIDLEAFIHGALCYAVSGRCYWSSYMGGKSGIRGRCVQPCRRVYTQKGKKERFFSCQDLGLDVLVRPLAQIPEVRTWKIEGRKKGPHYVYYTVKAYTILRNPESTARDRQDAQELLKLALGRPTSHYNFLPQKSHNPVSQDSHTGSGLFVSKTKGAARNPSISPRMELLPGDLLRVGFEDQAGHGTIKVRARIPKGGRLDLRMPPKVFPAPGTPVFLVDRREQDLVNILREIREELKTISVPGARESKFTAALPKPGKKGTPATEITVFRHLSGGGPRGRQVVSGMWLIPGSERKVPKPLFSRVWWWLPPVIWPGEEKGWRELIRNVIRSGGKTFVLGAPWQREFFQDLKHITLWAGPFCNLGNPLAIQAMARLGCCGAIVSPELNREDFLELPAKSPLPLGVVQHGNWPLCIARTVSPHLKTTESFASPKGEEAWTRKYGQNYWTYPNWVVDLKEKKGDLAKAGYTLFVNLVEPLPKGVTMKHRSGLWNWDLKMV